MTDTSSPTAAGKATAAAPEEAAAPAAPATRRPAVLAACMLAMFMAAIEATIVATAMPTIVAVLGGFELFSWVFAIYLLAQAVSIPVYGRLADIFGRKPVFYAGVSGFLAASLLAGFAQSMLQLIAFRAVQGLGAGAIAPLALTIVGDIYTPAERARKQGYLSSVWGVSAIAGPALGAFFVQHLTWSLVFWINLPIGLASMALMHLFLHESVEHRRHRIDYAGVILLTVGTTSLMLALVQGSTLPGPALLALAVVSAAALAAFIRTERRVEEPMMPLELWRTPVIALGNSAMLVSGAILMAVISFLPTYVQGVMGGSATVAGFAMAVMSVGWPLAATTAGRVMLYTSYRFTALAGALGLIAGSAVLMSLDPGRTATWAGVGSFLVGVGMGLTHTTYMVAIQTSVPWHQRGVATSGILFMRFVGMSAGAALFGAVVNFGLHARVPGETDVVNQLMTPGMRRTLDPARIDALAGALDRSLFWVFAIGGVLAVVTLVPALRTPRGLRPQRTADEG